MAKKKNHEQSIKEEAKKKAIDLIIKNYGAGSVMSLGEGEVQNIQAISTGSLGLDIATGIGGVPRGRIVEIFGPESAGKSTLALHIVANAQKNGGSAAYIDAENAFDPAYAMKLGVNIKDLIISQPDNAEQGLDIVEKLAQSGAFDVIVIDSVAALVPRKEVEGDMGDSHMGLQARLMGQAMRKLTGVASKSKTCIFFINQIREKIGVLFGSNETTPGGKALKFYSSMRFDIRRITDIKEGDRKIGSKVRVKVIKNKCSIPFKQAEFDVLYGEGINYLGEIIDVGVNENIIEKSGAWFSFDSQRIGQGRENSKQFLKENPDTFEKIRNKVEDVLKSKNNINLIRTDQNEEVEEEFAGELATETEGY